MHEVVNYSDRVVVMREGRVVYQRATADTSAEQLVETMGHGPAIRTPDASDTLHARQGQADTLRVHARLTPNGLPLDAPPARSSALRDSRDTARPGCSR
jgi:ribose transport system ATP-binding protein